MIATKKKPVAFYVPVDYPSGVDRSNVFGLYSLEVKGDLKAIPFKIRKMIFPLFEETRDLVGWPSSEKRITSFHTLIWHLHHAFLRKGVIRYGRGGKSFDSMVGYFGKLGWAVPYVGIAYSKKSRLLPTVKFSERVSPIVISSGLDRIGVHNRLTKEEEAQKYKIKRRENPLNKLCRLIGYRSYDQYLDSDYWKGFHERYRKSGNPLHCLCCHSPQYQLHHKDYSRLGREIFDDVAPLCRKCHTEVHRVSNQFAISLKDVWTAIKIVRRSL